MIWITVNKSILCLTSDILIIHTMVQHQAVGDQLLTNRPTCLKINGQLLRQTQVKYQSVWIWWFSDGVYVRDVLSRDRYCMGNSSPSRRPDRVDRAACEATSQYWHTSNCRQIELPAPTELRRLKKTATGYRVLASDAERCVTQDLHKWWTFQNLITCLGFSRGADSSRVSHSHKACWETSFSQPPWHM